MRVTNYENCFNRLMTLETPYYNLSLGALLIRHLPALSPPMNTCIPPMLSRTQSMSAESSGSRMDSGIIGLGRRAKVNYYPTVRPSRD